MTLVGGGAADCGLGRLGLHPGVTAPPGAILAKLWARIAPRTAGCKPRRPDPQSAAPPPTKVLFPPGQHGEARTPLCTGRHEPPSRTLVDKRI